MSDLYILYNYVFGMIFVAFYILLQYLIGAAFFKKKGSYPSHFIAGFLIFSFFVALGGIPIQLINAPWIVFVLYLCLVIVSLFLWSIWRLKKNSLQIVDKNEIKNFIASQWFVIFVGFFLVGISFSHISYLWMNNNMDDGFYLGWVSSIPYSKSGFYTHPSIGYASNLSSMFSYLVNTGYSEYAAYVYLFKLNTSVFCRVFMAFFNYFLSGMLVTEFSRFICKETKFEITEFYYQYFSLVLILFGIPFSLVEGGALISVQDGWQFNSAMYYGSNLTRVNGILLLVLFFLRTKKINLQTILSVAAIGFVMVSKSTIAIPSIIICSLSFLIACLVTSKDKKSYVFFILILLLCFFISLLLGNTSTISEPIATYFSLSCHSKVFIIAVLLCISCLLFKSQYLNRMIIFLIVVFAFIVLEPFNNIFEKSAVFDFVSKRIYANYLYTIVTIAFIMLVVNISTVFHIRAFKAYFSIIVVLILTLNVSLSRDYSYSENSGLGMTESAKILWHNKFIMPNSTVMLGNALEERYETTHETCVALTPEVLPMNSVYHSLSIILRTVSPHTISISASNRYGFDKAKYKDFSQDYQQIYYDFMTNPNDSTNAKLEKVISKCFINSVVVLSDEYDYYLKQDGFKIFKHIVDVDNGVQYYLYCK